MLNLMLLTGLLQAVINDPGGTIMIPIVLVGLLIIIGAFYAYVLTVKRND